MESELEKSNNKKRICVILIILGLVFILVGYFINNIGKQSTNNNGEDKIDKDEAELIYDLEVYKSESGYLCLKKDDSYCKELAFVIKTETENNKLLAFDKEYKFVLYSDDDNLKIYNRELDESQGILLEDKYEKYEIYTNSSKDNIEGILYQTTSENSSITGYFNVLTGKKMYNEKYETLSSDSSNELLQGCKNSTIYLLNKSEEIEELSFKNPENIECSGHYVYGFQVEKYNDKQFYRVVGEFETETVYSNSKQVIYDKKLKEQEISFNDGFVYFVNDKKVKKYDIDGNLISTSKEYKDIKGLLNNYVIYVKDGNLVLDNLDIEETKIIDKWNSENNSNIEFMGYFSREKLDSMGETTKPEGSYMVVYYKEQDANGNYGIEYCYTTDKEIKTFNVTTPGGGRAKPVLYLYPTKKTNVEIEFAHPEYLKTTYPKYIFNWKVIAYPNGDLYDEDNKYYYALFWDEIRYNETDFHEGFYVEKQDATKFLEEKLTILGLNAKEKNEFIMYWLPILENNEKSLVYFEQTKEREQTNKMNITPQPDSLLRISIHIKKVNEKTTIKEQTLNKFERVGFSAIEWGGMTY